MSTDPNEERRGFLRRVTAAAGSIPLAPALVGGAATGASTGVGAQGSPVTPATDAVVGYICFSQDEAAFARCDSGEIVCVRARSCTRSCARPTT